LEKYLFTNKRLIKSEGSFFFVAIINILWKKYNNGDNRQCTLEFWKSDFWYFIYKILMTLLDRLVQLFEMVWTLKLKKKTTLCCLKVSPYYTWKLHKNSDLLKNTYTFWVEKKNSMQIWRWYDVRLSFIFAQYFEHIL
jgi:hypothetical protein